MEKKIRIYIASPYTLGDTGMNVRNQILTGHELMKLGFFPYIPELHHFVHMICPLTYDEVMSLDLVWLECCDCVLRLPGESKGADIETEHALKNNIKVFYSIKEITDFYSECKRSKINDNIKKYFTKEEFNKLLYSNLELRKSLGWRNSNCGYRESDGLPKNIPQVEDYVSLKNNYNYWIYTSRVGCFGIKCSLKGDKYDELVEVEINKILNYDPADNITNETLMK